MTFEFRSRPGLLRRYENINSSPRVVYPPYHSKYNPVERCWGVLENHWNGALLDTVEAVVGYAQSMTWKQEHPVVRLVTQVYESGVRLSKQAMKAVECKLSGLPQLASWFIDIQL